MSGKKDDIQKQIESIDAELYNLLMQRTELVKQNTHPIKIENILGQEAMGIRRMMKFHKGDFPEYVVAKIWREILSASASLKEKLKIAIYGDENDTSLLHNVQEHFGSYIDVNILSSFSQVFNLVSSKEAHLAIIPCDNHEMNTKPWWNSLLVDKNKDSLNIVAKLPFLHNKNTVLSNEAYVIALSPSDASGVDNSVLSLETDATVSHSTISETIENMGFDAPKIIMSANTGEDKFTLVDINGFVAPDDKRLISIPEIFKSLHLSGTYARPIEL